MIVGSRLLKCLPERVNKNDPIIKALFSNDTETSSFETMFKYGQEVLDRFASVDDFYNYSDSELDYATSFFTKFARNFEESDNEIKERVKAVLNRKDDVTWGTAENIKHVFEQYFDTAKVYLLENCGEFTTTTDNLIETSNVNFVANPYFNDVSEEGDLLDWDSTLTGTISKEEAFCGSNSVKLESGQELTQTITIPNDEDFPDFATEDFYFLHFFCNGKTTVKVKKRELIFTSQDGLNVIDTEAMQNVQFENTNLWVIGEDLNTGNTTSRTTNNDLESEEWLPFCVLFKAKANDQIKIEFSNTQEAESGNVAYIGLVQLFKRQPFSQFCVIARFLTEAGTQQTLHLADGQEDLTPETQEEIERYENESYHDNTFISGGGSGGSIDVLNSILKLVKPCGIKAYIKVVMKESTETTQSTEGE